METVTHEGKAYKTLSRKPQVGDFVWYEEGNRFATVIKPGALADVPRETHLRTALDCGAVVLEQVVVETVEPTSGEKTIVHNGQTYKMVSRKARVGDLIQVTKHYGCPQTAGAIVTVKRVRDDGHVFYDKPSVNAGTGSRPGNYVVLEPVKNSVDRITTLESTVKSLTERVAALESKRIGGFTNEVYAKPVTKTLTRADVIEMAKKDVEELRHNGSREYFLTKHGVYCVVDWEINRKKRYVVVRMLGACSGNVYARGVAQCAPDDCFNVHIGKAIALRRALGLDIPSEYVNAPKPTTVSVGDVVTWPKWNTSYYIVKVHGNDVYDFRHVKSDEVYEHMDYENLGFNESNVLVDDSHDFGGQER